MAGKKQSLTGKVALGLRAVRGGGVAVAVSLEAGQPRIVLSTFLATGTQDDRLSFEPYYVAAEMKHGPGGKPTAQAAAAVAEGRKRQDKLAAEGLKDMAARLQEEGHELAIAALLINRAGWVTDLLEYSLAFADHPPVAEGLAVRDALRSGCQRNGITIAEMDEKSLPGLATEVLNRGPVALEARLKALGATAGKPWRKEQKLACLAAWVTLVSEGVPTAKPKPK